MSLLVVVAAVALVVLVVVIVTHYTHSISSTARKLIVKHRNTHAYTHTYKVVPVGLAACT